MQMIPELLLIVGRIKLLRGAGKEVWDSFTSYPQRGLRKCSTCSRILVNFETNCWVLVSQLEAGHMNNSPNFIRLDELKVALVTY